MHYFQLIDIEEEFLTLMDSSGDIKADLKLPSDEALADKIQEEFGDGSANKTISVSVIFLDLLLHLGVPSVFGVYQGTRLLSR